MNEVMVIEIRLSGINRESIVDGTGLRYVIFAQGCPHHCYQCHNPSTHCFTGGELRQTEELISDIFANPLLKGVTFSGGEPMEQAEAFLEIVHMLNSEEINARYQRKKRMDIWCYTGYLYEDILNFGSRYQKELLNHVDVLVDGKFVLEQKTIEKPFVGSSNQRVIDIAHSHEGAVSEIKFFS